MNKSHNYDAMLGGDTDDMELCQHYGLDSALAYTPKINEAIRLAVKQENFNDLTKAGYSEGQARSIADKHYQDALKGASFIKQ
jgi:hypothetical protein